MSEPILLGCLLERDPHPEFGPKEDGLSLAFRSSSSIRHIAFTKASTPSEPVSDPSQSFLHIARDRDIRARCDGEGNEDRTR